jgi:hypothetical protein
MTDFAALAQTAKAWPFEQARLVKKRVEKSGMKGGAVIFETGYGPSGLPHIGTFGEVARTTMVRHAFRVLTNDRISHQADLLFRRYGRHAQSAVQPAQSGHAGGISTSR